MTPVEPSSGGPLPARMRPNDAYFEVLIESLESLEPAARAQFLRRFFLSISHLDIPESQCVALWDQALARRGQLSAHGDEPVAFQTALVDVLLNAGKIHLPVILEYEELRGLQRNAITDPLTGLYNRRLFDETLEKELNRARRYANPLSLVALDLHQFKEVNDRYGHPRGDEVLRAAAATFRKALRTSDFAFRTGGDEFALILPQTDSAQANALGRRIGLVFADMLRGLHLAVSVGMDHGVATFPADGDQRDPLIRIADQRLYAFKGGSQGATQSAGSDQPVAVPVVGVPTPQPAAPPPQPAATAAAPPPNGSPSNISKPAFSVAPSESARIYAVPRKAERVSMIGTNAYAVLADQQVQRAKVVDLGFGGVALDFSRADNIPETLLAVLHVPILPPVRVSLRRVWSKQISPDTVRVGCCFVS